MDQQTSVSTQQANPNQPTKKSGNKLVKIGIIILLLILLGVGYLIYTSYSTNLKKLIQQQSLQHSQPQKL